MPTRPVLPPEHRHQCTPFLRELRWTGNVEASAHAASLSRSTVVGRRKRYPGFATQGDAAPAFAQAALAKRGGRVAPAGTTAKTQGGEYTVSGSGKRPIQVRRTAPGRLSEDGETAFLAALAATANVRLACDMVGVSHVAIYKRRELIHIADRIDDALKADTTSWNGRAWRRGSPRCRPTSVTTGGSNWASPLPTMSFDQVCQLLALHFKRPKLKEDRHAHNRHRMTAEETDAAITDPLARSRKRNDDAPARNERAAAREQVGEEEKAANKEEGGTAG